MAKEDPKINAVCGESDLQALTSNGWELVTHYEVDGSYPVRGMFDGTWQERTYQGKVRRFLLQSAPDTEIALARAHADSLERKVRDLEAKARDSSRALHAAESERERFKRDLELSQRDVLAYIEQVKKMRKMEEHLGKLRDHIGRKEFDKIVKAEEDDG